MFLCADHEFIAANYKNLPDNIRTGVDLSDAQDPVANSISAAAPAPYYTGDVHTFGVFAPQSASSVVQGPQMASPGQSNGTGNWGGGYYGAGSTTGAFSLRADGLPILNSNPGAKFTIFLDFDGFTGATYGGTKTFLPYDTGGDGTIFDATEQATIAEGWRRMATFMAPFDINVSTVQPTSTADDWSWSAITNSGGGYSWGQLGPGGPSALNGSSELLSRFSGVLHELGHNFGLGHQGTYDDFGARINEYRGHMDSIHGVIMGVDYDGYPNKWILGHRGYNGTDNITSQDDLAIITGKIKPYEAAGGDGYRADDFAGTIAAATALTVSGATQSRYGIVERKTDVDMFSFASTGGTYSIALTPDSPSSLDGHLEIYDGSGNLLAVSDPLTSVSGAITLALPAGTYYAAVSGHQNYDDLGTYQVSVSTATPGTTPTYNGLLAPTNVAAVLGTGSNLNLSWTLSTSSGVTGYTVEISTDNITWTTETTVSSSTTTYTDTGLAGSQRYYYRVSTNNASGKSVPSSVATIINRPSAVTGLRVASIDSSHLVVDWVETLGETGYKIERSLDNSTWSQIATVAADGVTYTDSTVAAGTTYYYRVTPTSALGDGVSAVDSATSRVAAPSNFTLTNVTSNSAQLNWTDLPNEDAYQIEVSNDGTTYSVLANLAANSTTYTASGLTGATEYYFRLAGKLNGLLGTQAVKFAPTATARPLPSGWASTDIGAPAVVGVGDYNGGVIKSIGATGDFWNSSDSGRYTYTTLNGDGQLVARVTGVENNAGWVKYGVMMRESTAANSRHAFMIISSASGASFQYRTGTGGSSSSVTTAGIAAPYWVKITRAGNVFTGSISADGSAWTTVGTATITMATSIKMGLALATNTTATLTTATADSIAGISGGVAINMPPSAVADSATTTNLTPVTVNILSNDTDPEGGSITLTGITQGTWGNVVINGDNTLTYTPTDSVAHTDTFTYTISDPAGNTDVATVTINKKGQLHRWEYEDGAGSTVTDVSGNNAPGSIANAAWIAGRTGKALTYNGASTGGQLSFGTGASLSGTTDFSVGVWVKTSSTSTGYLFSQRDSDIAGEYALSMSGGKVAFFLYNGGYQFNLTSSNTTNDGNWHYVLAERSGLVGTIYIDGTSRATATGSSILALGGTIDTFSGWDGRDGGSFYNGQMDDLTLYNYALSTTEITANRDAPGIVTPATASATTVTGTSVNLSTLGIDYSGESTLKYTWSVLGTPPAPVSFTMNGSNGGKNTTAMFIKTGTYNFQVAITDGTTTLTSTASVVVVSTLTSLSISPASPSLQPGQAQQFSATAYDQFGEMMTAAVTWSLGAGSAGTIDANGLYTAAQGNATVVATSGTVSGSTPVTVASSAPTVATPASATSSTVTGTTVGLSVLGADDAGESSLTYLWSVQGGPSSVAFSINGSNASKNTVATFNMAGTYTLRATMTDSGGASVSSAVTVTVVQTAQSIKVTPASASVGTNQTKQFAASGIDQFGQSIASPAVTWSVSSGAGTVSSTGLFTAPAMTGTSTVLATLGALSASATASIFAWSPYNLTGKKTAGNKIGLTWRDSTTIESGFEIQVGLRQSNGTILWSTSYTTGAAAGSGGTVTYNFASGFTAGTWGFRVRATSASGYSNWSNSVLVTV